jgi:hypothetical protein
MQLFGAPLCSLLFRAPPLGSKLPQHPLLEHPQPTFFPNVQTKFHTRTIYTTGSYCIRYVSTQQATRHDPRTNSTGRSYSFTCSKLLRSCVTNCWCRSEVFEQASCCSAFRSQDRSVFVCLGYPVSGLCLCLFLQCSCQAGIAQGASARPSGAAGSIAG